MRRIILIIVIIIVAIVVTFFIYKSFPSEKEAPIITEVKMSDFEVIVSSTGELQAQSFVKIMGPTGLRSVGIFTEIKILHMIPEGSVVDSGDYIARLDPSEVTSKLKNLESELQEIEARHLQTKLNSTLNLRNAKDEMVNLEYAIEEYKIELEQSKYETPANIRRAEINLEKAKRAYKQSSSNYDLKEEKAKAEISEVAAALSQKKHMKDNLIAVLDEFEIRAPKPGMLIYHKSWRGKVATGSSLNSWNPIVATLPDFSTMISKTYINEIDISKIKLNQKVIIGIDAFPKKKYSGSVIEIANIGEKLPKSNVKVFEVLIKINELDSILRPAMTTSNKILTANYEDVLFTSLDAINNNDSLTFVYKKEGRVVKQIVILGASNENEVIIEKGLEEGDKVLLSIPENSDKIEFSSFEIYEEIKERKKVEAAKIDSAEQIQKTYKNDKPKSNKGNKGKNKEIFKKFSKEAKGK